MTPPRNAVLRSRGGVTHSGETRLVSVVENKLKLWRAKVLAEIIVILSGKNKDLKYYSGMLWHSIRTNKDLKYYSGML